ncbi:MAG: hypothetical protein E6K73_09585, partial [Candidatus Eisenbacteria bacterium]
MARRARRSPARPRGGGPVSAPARAGAASPLLLDPDGLLDRERLLGTLAGALRDPRGELASVEPLYVRAKRGRSAALGLVLAWRAGARTHLTRAALYLAPPARVGEAAAKARTLRIVEPKLGPSVALLEEPPALLVAFPNDRLLRGLSAAADPRRLKNRLHRVESPFAPGALRIRRRGTEVVPLRWKPGRRAVLRADLALADERSHCSGPATLYVRVYPLRHLGLQVARWQAAALVREVHSPQVLAVDVQRGFLAVEATGGAPAAGLGDVRSETRSPLAEMLGALYRAGAGRAPPLPAGALDMLPRRGDRDDLEAALRAMRDLAAWEPDLETPCRELESRLEAAAARLPACEPCFVHGDLTADQVLAGEGSIALIDWDEAAVGDPHTDLASLAADLALRGDEAGAEAEFAGLELPSEAPRGPREARASHAAPGRGAAATIAAIEPMALDILEKSWSPDRWRWQLALAFARRCLGAFQAARPDWRGQARLCLEEALRWCPEREARPNARAVATPGPGLPAGFEARLGALWAPDRRESLGLAATSGVLAAVWPQGSGAAARFERLDDPRALPVWLQVGSEIETWCFPDDPELRGLAPLWGTGRYRLAGLRLGRRAVLREAGAGGRFLHFRPAHAGRAAYDRLLAVHAALAISGLAGASLPEWAPELHGWRAEAVEGRPLDPCRHGPGSLEALGRALAPVHATAAPESLPELGLGDAACAAGRQIELVRRAGIPFGSWLEAELGRASEPWRARRANPQKRSALVHGDLHPAQVLAGERITILDWERAHRGDPEEDLGNLAAHLYWAGGEAAEPAWRALARGYRDAGGD